MFPKYTMEDQTRECALHFATRKRLNANGYRGGHDNPTFHELYERFNGPTLEQLFDTEKLYSPFVYNFLIVHPSLQLVSKADIGQGYMIYLGVDQMWTSETSPYDPDLVDWNYVSLSGVSRDLNVVRQNPTQYIYEQPYLNKDQADHHLTYGWIDPNLVSQPQDPRLSFGEFIIMTLYQEGVIVKQFRIYSAAYSWRQQIRNDNPNLKNQFYALTTDALGFYSDGGNRSAFAGRAKNPQQFYTRFVNKYPIIDHSEASIVDLLESGNYLTNVDLITDPKAIRKLILGPDQRKSVDTAFKIIWTNLILAVPFSEQAKVAEFLDDFFVSRDELITFVRNMTDIDNYDVLLGPDDSRHFNRIISEARKSAQQAIDSGKAKTQDLQEEVGTSISNYLMKERGRSLYQMVRTMYKSLDTSKVEAQMYSDIPEPN